MSVCHAEGVNIGAIGMSKRSLKLSREGIKKANKALKGKNWSKEYLAGHVVLSASTIHNFYNTWKFGILKAFSFSDFDALQTVSILEVFEHGNLKQVSPSISNKSACQP